ncbi:hypothetical protein BDV93DRAFT_515901 [Ceratobasidium sp. AG-I]|nr:hypothetical protein BDV93DRAFT_515901 [Ceratobasidium sp. AG-I]
MLLSTPLLPGAWHTFLWSSQPWDCCPLCTKETKCLKIPLGEVLGALACNGLDGLGGDFTGKLPPFSGVLASAPSEESTPSQVVLNAFCTIGSAWKSYHRQMYLGLKCLGEICVVKAIFVAHVRRRVT